MTVTAAGTGICRMCWMAGHTITSYLRIRVLVVPVAHRAFRVHRRDRHGMAARALGRCHTHVQLPASMRGGVTLRTSAYVPLRAWYCTLAPLIGDDCIEDRGPCTRTRHLLGILRIMTAATLLHLDRCVRIIVDDRGNDQSKGNHYQQCK
jgi:hypothetical protein